jgi:hypothetical protein
MSQTTFQTITADDMQSMHNTHWQDAPAALGVPLIVTDEDAVHPVSAALPYHVAFETYVAHTEACPTCSTASLWDQCPEGTRLAGLSADACAAQDDLAGQN